MDCILSVIFHFDFYFFLFFKHFPFFCISFFLDIISFVFFHSLCFAFSYFLGPPDMLNDWLHRSQSFKSYSSSANHEILHISQNLAVNIHILKNHTHQREFWPLHAILLLSHPPSLTQILISSYHLFLRLPSRLFPSGFPTKNQVWISLLPKSSTRPAIMSIVIWSPE